MNICRVCLKFDNEILISLNTLIENQSIAEMIYFCSGIEILSYDDLPQNLCAQCLSAIKAACKIKELCIDSDIKLRHQIKDEEIFIPSIKLSTQPDALNLEIFQEKIVKEESCEILEYERPHRKIKRRKSLSSSRSQSPEADFIQRNSKLKLQSNIFKCYLCNANFRYRKEKYEHLETVHTSDELKCKLCRHKSQTTRGMDNHMMIHEYPELLSHMCHICSKNYQKACELRRHIKLAHGDKSKRQINFFCDHCDFKTFSKMNMKRHLNTIHLKIKKFICKYCPEKKYTSKITLDQHMITKHGQETDFICQCCKRKFPTMSFLRSHMKATCSGSANLVRERGDPNSYRERIDDETDNYRCKLCGLIFEGKGKIAQHYAQRHKHSNACNQCPASFNSYSNLKKHIQILHNKIHKYVCSYCSKSFGQSNQLQSHINTHTGQKPFKCKFEYCTYRSGDLSAVSKHQKKCSNNPANVMI